MSKPMIKHCQNCRYFEIEKIKCVDMFADPYTRKIGKCDIKYKNVPKFLRRVTALFCKYYREDENIANEYD